MKRYAIGVTVVVLLITWTGIESMADPPQSAPTGVDAKEMDLHAAKTRADVDVESTKEGETPTSLWMEKKLKHSQAILGALAMGDFSQVKYNASRLQLLNRVEGFVRRRNPDYRVHLNTFSRVVTEIERQAEKENIEGATLAFNQLTVSCVQCHKTLRGVEGRSSGSENGHPNE